MSNSFYVDNILDKNNPNEGLIIDFKYPGGAVYRSQPNKDIHVLPKLCFSEHALCRRIGIPGCCDTRFLFYNDHPNRFTNWNIPPIINFSNSSHVNPNLTNWIVPPVIDFVNSSHVNHNLTNFVAPPIIDPANSPPVDAALVPNIRFENAFQSARKHGAIPKWSTIPKTYPDQIQTKSSAFSELAKNISEKCTLRDNNRFLASQRNGSLITSNAFSSTSKKSPEKSVQNNKSFSESQASGSLIISNADSSTSKMSPERRIKSPKKHPVQVINSSETLLNQVINSSKRSRQVRTEQVERFPSTSPEQVERFPSTSSEQVERFPSTSPEQVQYISRPNPIVKRTIFSRWKKPMIFDNHVELPTSNSRIVPETFRNTPGANPVPVQNAFPGWYCRLSTSIGQQEPNMKQEVKPETRKRKRTTFSSGQLVYLEHNYDLEGKYLSRLKRIQVAAELGLSEKQVKVWFQNRRVRDKPKVEPKVEPEEGPPGKRVKYEDEADENDM